MTIRKGVVAEGEEVEDFMMFRPGLVLLEFVGKKKVCKEGGIRVVLCAGNGPSEHVMDGLLVVGRRGQIESCPDLCIPCPLVIPREAFSGQAGMVGEGGVQGGIGSPLLCPSWVESKEGLAENGRGATANCLFVSFQGFDGRRQNVPKRWEGRGVLLVPCPDVDG
jgi:hypothetical protein